LALSALEITLRLKTIRGVRYTGMVFGIVGSQLLSNAKLPTAEMVGSAYKITPISLLPDHVRRPGSIGAIHTDGYVVFRNSSGGFTKFAAIRHAY